MEKYNVAIIGAGTAGCITALLCSRAGLSTILIDKRSFPRNKACGGGLTTKSIALLKKFNCYDEQQIEKFFNGVQIYLSDLGKKYLIRSDELYLAAVERNSFDSSLLSFAKKAGVEFKEKERLIKFKTQLAGKIEIQTDKNTYFTEVLVGADGAMSYIRRQLQKEFPKLFPERNYFIAVKTELTKENLTNFSDQYPHLFFNFTKGIDYGWAFPKKKSFNVGFGYNPDQRFAIDIHKVFHFFLLEVLKIKNPQPKTQAALLPIFHSKKKSAVQKGTILLVGDAAGFVDEWTGEGIYYCLKSGEYASEAIIAYFCKNKDLVQIARYSKLCAKNIYRSLNYSHFFAYLIRNHPQIYRYLQDSQLRNLFIPFVQGYLSYRQAVRKSVPRVLGAKFVELIT